MSYNIQLKTLKQQLKEYDVVFITNLPSFYKVRQWNEIAKVKKVLIVFLNSQEGDRNKDFISECPQFDCFTLSSKFCVSIIELFRILKNIKFNNLLLGGWDDIRLLGLILLNPKSSKSLLCESSIYECSSNVVKNFIKKVLLKRVSKVFPSGIPQGEIFKKLNYQGEIIYTGGCGLLNYIEQPPYKPRLSVKSFLYVGRFVDVKNLDMLINVFNKLPQFDLFLIGFGEQEKGLRSIAGENVKFLGAIDNKLLSQYYQNTDVFILPSKVEPWGLVVEEALNNGTPVIVSDKVGSKDDLVKDEFGVVFNSTSEDSLIDAITKITQIDFYNQLRYNISKYNFKQRAQHQIDVFINEF